MKETENPYSPPRENPDSYSSASQKASLNGKRLVAIVVRIVFRFFGSLATTFFVLIDLKGLGVNWPNVLPLLAILWMGCIVSHFRLNLRSTSDRLNLITGWPLYLAGTIVAMIIVATEMHPKGL
ncbi:hypothetical protein SH449x_004491 [Pirellulaceae bacterium SH449]